MALKDTFIKSGNFLFKYRGQIPVLIFILALPFAFFMPVKVQNFLIAPHATVWIYIITILAILISLVGFGIRCYTIGTTPHGTSGRNRDKQVAKELNTKGIYSIVRHPLYLGNYLMWLGLLIFTFNISLIIIVSLVYWLYYERIMFTEENYLEQQFGEAFHQWSANVPAFIPNLKSFEKSPIPFSFKTVLRREYSSVFSFVFSFTIVDYLKTLNLKYFCDYPVQWWRPSLFILCFFLLLMLTLRTLKHHTPYLNKVPNRD